MVRRPRSTLPLALLAAVLAAACGDDPQAPQSPEPTAASPLLAAATCTLFGDVDAVRERIGALHALVDGLEADGTLNAGQLRALRRHLDNALRQLDRGETCAVRDQLQAFLAQLGDLVSQGFLSDREAFELRLQARLTAGGGEPVQAGAEEYAPGVAGEVRTLQVPGGEIPYTVVDGLAVVGGDIILGFADEVEAAAAGALGPAGGGGPQAVGPCSGSNIFCEEWSDGVIGYDYFRDWGDFDDNQLMIDRIQEAIAHWEDKTGLRFERRATGQRIVFRNGSGCSSYIGRNPFAIFDPQYVFLNYDPMGGPDCRSVGTIIHEIGHAVGFWHEQSRNDRGDFVRIDFGAIEEFKEGNFFQFLSLGEDLGDYDYGSIMHYPCDAFQKDGVTRNTIEPTEPGVTCDDIGQRDALSESNVLGAYWLYPPVWDIGGAENGDVRDRFSLFIDFDTEPVDPDYIEWTVNRSAVSTGLTFSTLDAGLAPGDYVIGANLIIDDHFLGFRAVRITIRNDAPVVRLGDDRTVDLNRDVIVTASVTDTEDGSCPVTACSYSWDPAPASDLGGAARYRFTTVPPGGTATVRVTVTDGAGATGSDEVVLTVVDSDPVPVIDSPAPGASFPSGATTTFAGSATDANAGPGPGPGTLSCAALAWSSSDPSDVFSTAIGCDGTVTFGDPGARTLTLQATDPTGNVGTTSRTVQVDDCAGGCAPIVSFVVDTPAELNGASFSPPFTGPGYYLDTELQMTASIADDASTTVSLEWTVQPPCIGGCDPIVIASGSVLPPNNDVVTWRPSDDLSTWSNCALTALPFVVRLTATDVGGASRTYTRTIYLACRLI